MQDDGGWVWSIDGSDLLKGTRLARDNRAVTHRVQCPLNVRRGEAAAVVKANARSQMKNPLQRIGVVPGEGECGMQLKVLAATHQSIEEQFIDSFRLRVGTDARVKIRGAALDQDCQRG